jgi:isoleucyl-tRNA synthetase
MRRNDDAADRDAAFGTMHASLLGLARLAAPILPFLTEAIYDNLLGDLGGAPDSIHLTAYPDAQLASRRDTDLETAMATARRAVELARTLRSTAGIRTRQPLARLWLTLPGGSLAGQDELLAMIRDEVNVKAVEVIGDESELVERRVKPLLPRIGKRLGAAIPAVMAAARAGEVAFRDDGSVELGGQVLAADEVEIQATPRPGTAVASDEGLVVVIDTELTPELRAEGDARELQRAVQDLRRDAGLELDDRIELWVDGLPADVAAHLGTVATETLATVGEGSAPAGDGVTRGTVELGAGQASIALRRTVAAGNRA